MLTRLFSAFPCHNSDVKMGDFFTNVMDWIGYRDPRGLNACPHTIRVGHFRTQSDTEAIQHARCLLDTDTGKTKTIESHDKLE